ncbi:MAG TPA: EamA family transporter [Syntrophomonadaceae bacterium]|nr:EamA family transporter [Syntrophomonadaceae bacterium]
MNKLKLSFVMLLWGSIGVFTRYINVSPILLAFLRALIAVPSLYIFHRINKSQSEFNIKRLIPFIISGCILGLAWVCLFTAFKNTSISIALLVYNMCPVYVLISAPIILKERLSKIQIATVAGAFLGLLIIVSSAINAKDFNLTGLGFGIVSGLLYASLVFINRIVKTEFDSSTITLIQMVSASIVLLPFVISEGQLMFIDKLSSVSILFIFILGFIHTGIAYNLYFSTYKKLSAVTIVSYSYLEPVFGIILSVVILGELISINQIIGGILILGSTYFENILGNLKNIQGKS